MPGRSPQRFLTLGWAIACIVGPAWCAAQQKVQYNRDVRPILADACFSCHGPDSAARQADLRLDQRDSALEMAAIVPGEPDQSELLRRIFSEEPYERMPPPETKKHLTPAQRETLRQWIAAGAEYEPHWSFIPPPPGAPEVQDEGWVRNEIDRFILARLEEAALEPNPAADRRTLARRVALDLTGLPPTPETVDAFVADQRPGAYERLVDQLLASPHYGEHRARYWLDAARYADTHGLHFDNFREMWTYRDWVIDALNENMPFDQFTIEQLAGDLLPDPTLDQQIASGFNRCNVTTNEGGTIDKETLVFYNRDRTETFGQVWLGLTVGCAVCHDHKFDPVSQREFYSLAAFFNNTSQAAKDGNISDTPPVVFAPRPEDRSRWTALQAETSATEQQLAARRAASRADLDQWLATLDVRGVEPQPPSDGLQLHAPLDEGEGATTSAVVEGETVSGTLNENAAWKEGPFGGHALEPNGDALEHPTAGDFERTDRFAVSVWVNATANDSQGPIVSRMDAPRKHRGWDVLVSGRRIMPHIIHDWPKDALKVKTKAQLPANQWVHVAVTYDGSGQAAGVKIYFDGVLQELDHERDALTGTIRTDVPLIIGKRYGEGSLAGVALWDLRLYERTLAPLETMLMAKGRRLQEILAGNVETLDDGDRELLANWRLLRFDPEYAPLQAQSQAQQLEEAGIRRRGAVAYVMEERDEPAMAYVLERGAYDQRREQVRPDTPAILPAMDDSLPPDRYGLAQWVVQPEHPLMARVTVNRFWQEIFGIGFVATSGDFGVAGELPSHPELLDWLAIDFRENGWNVKRLIKQLVMSAAYRQNATITPAEREQDPLNRLLARGPRFRMDAEMVRDYALAASGLLVREIGGPSVKPYQPRGVWEAVAIDGSNTQFYERDSGDDLYRRSLYTFWKRSAPPASMEIFNAPSREFCVVSRERTNTPLQALVALNDVQLVEAARHLAERVLNESSRFEEALRQMSMHILCRPLDPAETSVVRNTFEQLLHHYQQRPEDAAELLAYGEIETDPSLDPAQLAAWTMVANQLLNLDEALNK